MEEELEMQGEPQKPYEPRPAWQVWAARLGLVLFLIFLLFYYLNIFGGRG